MVDRKIDSTALVACRSWLLVPLLCFACHGAEQITPLAGLRRGRTSIAASLTVSPEDDPAERADARPQLKFSIDDCIRRMLRNHYDISIERLSPRRAAHDVVEEQADFDTRIQVTGSVSRSRVPSRSVTQFSAAGATSVTKSKDNSEGLETGLVKKIVTGADLGVSLLAKRDYNIVGAAATNPYYTTDVSLSMTQPLLRNGWLPYNRASIRIAHNARLVSVWAFKSSVMESLFDVQGAYWNLARSIENLRVSREALHRAKRLYENNRIKVRAGIMAEIEMLQALAEVASQREGVIVAQKEVRDREDDLKGLMNLCGADGRMSDARLVPTSSVSFEAVQVDRQECLRQARLNRPEYFMTELELRNERLRLMRYKNQMLPKLDLSGKMTYHGRSNSYRSAWRRVNHQMRMSPDSTKLYTGSVSLAFEYPIGNRAAESRYLKSRLDVTRRRLERERSDLRIQTEVRASVREVQTNVERVKANRVATILTRARLRAEEKKLSVGKSTSFDVLQAQEDLAVSERNEVRAIVDYRVSIVRLERVQGTLLEACNVHISESE